MPRKINIGVLGSTRGTDLQAVIDAIKAGELPNIDLQIVIANKSDAYILERAKSQGFSALFLDPKGKTREEYDAEILDVMKENQVELILCLGYMKIITKTLIDQYRDRIWNIHPSLLPKYAGGMDLNVHEEVLKNHETESGCTLHVITEQVDAGKIIKKKKVLITAEETTETLKKKVQKLEQAAIIEALKEYSNA